MLPFQLRPYRPADCASLAALFYDTVHTVNAKDYTNAQLDAWADGDVDPDAWNASFLSHTTYVAVLPHENKDEAGDGDGDDKYHGDDEDSSYIGREENCHGDDMKERIIGFGDMDASGYLDRLYVHKDYQGQGVATAICDRLEEEIQTDAFSTHASITARPFFEKRGYTVVKAQQVVRKGVSIRNYVMRKRIEYSV